MRRRFYTRRMLGRGIAIVVVASLLLPAGATSQSNRPDPDSPAGVEYELPLDQTRKDLSDDGGGGPAGRRDGATPGASGDSGDGGPVPLFGAGISRDASVAGEGRDQRPSNDDPAKAGAGGGSPADDNTSEPDPGVAKASTGDGSTDLLLPGLALLVILSGGAMGLLLRRGLGPSGT